jgi:hypothetical protein
MAAAAAFAAVAASVRWAAPAAVHPIVRQVPGCARLDPAGRHEADQLGALRLTGDDDRPPPFPLGLVPGVVATLGGSWS